MSSVQEPLLNHAQPGLGDGNREFYFPPTTHFIATIEDLTDMLDYASEDIRGVGVLDSGVSSHACLRPTTWLHRWPGTAQLQHQHRKTLATGQAS